MGEHWRNLANTIEPSVWGDDAVLCQTALTTCLLIFFPACKMVLKAKKNGPNMMGGQMSAGPVSGLERILDARNHIPLSQSPLV